jgi:hypothetical protein
MKSLLEGLTEGAVTPIAEIGGRLVVTAALAALGVVCATVAVGFLTSGLYEIVERSLGDLVALLTVGVLYAGVAAAFAVVVYRRGPVHGSDALRTDAGKQDIAHDIAQDFAPAPAPALGSFETSRSTAADTEAIGAENRESEIGRVLERFAPPVLDLLQERGMHGERIALETAVAAAKELRPFMLVGLVMIMGAAVGHFARRQS